MIIINIIGLVLLVAIFSIYINLIKKKNTVAEAFASIDVQLKKRYDLIPNILAIASKFMEHERNLMNSITELRGQAMRIPADMKHAKTKLELDNKITNLIGQLNITAENYPQLKSDQAMVNAMRVYNSTEERIAAARRYYNAAVKDLNNSVEIFPSSIVANLLGIKKADFIKAEEVERSAINVNDNLH